MLGDGGSGKAVVHVLELLGAHCFISHVIYRDDDKSSNTSDKMGD